MRATQSRTQTWPVNQGRGQGVFGENACLGHSGRGTERRDRREPGLAALKSVYILALRNQVRMSWMVRAGSLPCQKETLQIGKGTQGSRSVRWELEISVWSQGSLHAQMDR